MKSVFATVNDLIYTVFCGIFCMFIVSYLEEMGFSSKYMGVYMTMVVNESSVCRVVYEHSSVCKECGNVG